MKPRIIVPGHGETLRDTSYLELVADLQDSVIAQVRKAFANGAVSAEEVQEKVDLRAFRDRFGEGDEERAQAFDGSVPSWVKKVYQEQRDGMESQR